MLVLDKMQISLIEKQIDLLEYSSNKQCVECNSVQF